jgi:hypothetical protein
LVNPSPDPSAEAKRSRCMTFHLGFATDSLVLALAIVLTPQAQTMLGSAWDRLKGLFGKKLLSNLWRFNIHVRRKSGKDREVEIDITCETMAKPPSETFPSPGKALLENTRAAMGSDEPPVPPFATSLQRDEVSPPPPIYPRLPDSNEQCLNTGETTGRERKRQHPKRNHYRKEGRRHVRKQGRRM